MAEPGTLDGRFSKHEISKIAAVEAPSSGRMASIEISISLEGAAGITVSTPYNTWSSDWVSPRGRVLVGRVGCQRVAPWLIIQVLAPRKRKFPCNAGNLVQWRSRLLF